MSSTQPAGTGPQLASPKPAHPRRWIAFASILIGLLGCCATLLSQRSTSAQSVNTNPTPAPLPSDQAPDFTSGLSPSLAETDLHALTVETARHQLNAAQEQLAEFESSMQDQLAELRSHQADTYLATMAQQAIATSGTACFQTAARVERDRQLTQELEAAQTDPLAWFRISADALAPHTTLRQLLVELQAAQAHTAHLLKTRLPAHPAVGSARATEQELQANLQQELAEVLPQRRAALNADDRRLAELRDELQSQELRARQLVALAVEYDRYLANVRTYTAVLRQAEQRRGATFDTEAAATALQRDNPGSIAASVPQRNSLLHEPEAQPTKSDSLVSGSRTLLILFGAFGGLFACMGYFYLTSSRHIAPGIAPSITPAISPDQCERPFIIDADRLPTAAQPHPSETAKDTLVPASPTESTHSPTTPSNATGPTPPTPGASCAVPRLEVSDPRGLHPTGRMTLRNALMRCADRAHRTG